MGGPTPRVCVGGPTPRVCVGSSTPRVFVGSPSPRVCVGSPMQSRSQGPASFVGDSINVGLPSGMDSGASGHCNTEVLGYTIYI